MPGTVLTHGSVILGKKTCPNHAFLETNLSKKKKIPIITWIELNIDSPVAEIFYQPDSYKSCTLVDPDRWSQEHLWITKDFWILGGLLVGTERTVSSQRIYWKDSLAQRTVGQLKDQAQQLGKIRRRRYIRFLADIPLQNGPVETQLAPPVCGPHGCWPWTQTALIPLPPLEKGYPVSPHLTSINFSSLWGLRIGEPCAHLSLWLGWQGCWDRGTHLCSYFRGSRALPPQKAYVQGHSPNTGRASK